MAHKVDAHTVTGQSVGMWLWIAPCRSRVDGHFHQADGLLMPCSALSHSFSSKQCHLSLSGHMQWLCLQQVLATQAAMLLLPTC